MKPFTLPPVTLGLDVVTPEGALSNGAVRRATNVALLNDGGFQCRSGYTTLATLAGTHSFWRSPAQTRAVVAAGDTLYDVDLATGGVAALFTGLQPDEPVSYEDVGPDIYVTSPGITRKIDVYGTVRRPGVADLFGSLPTLTTTLGSLYPGRYGVAYSLHNDLGEESPISSIAWIDLAATGGILLSGLQTAANVTQVSLYITTPGGGDLYRHATRAFAATQTITDQTTQKIATRLNKQPLPSGTIVRLYNGRLYVVDGKTIWPSDPLDYGVMDVEGGWMTFNRTITMFEPVRGGIFVGMRERTLFLRGDHGAFTQIPASNRGALPQSSCKVPDDFFASRTNDRTNEPAAVWLSDVGLAIGHPDGSITYPQADRIRVTGGVSPPLFFQHGGIKQGVFCVESMHLGTGGATDLTT